MSNICFSELLGGVGLKDDHDRVVTQSRVRHTDTLPLLSITNFN